MSDSITFNFSCPRCNGAVTWPSDAIDDTPIVCKVCDVTYGTYAEMKAVAMKAAKAEARKMFRKALKGHKGVKFV